MAQDLAMGVAVVLITLFVLNRKFAKPLKDLIEK